MSNVFTDPWVVMMWLRRNWRWVVPLFVIVTMLLAGGVTLLVFGILRSSTPVNMAMQELRASESAKRALGEPIQLGYVVTGNMTSRRRSGNATLEIPVSGERADGTAYVEAIKTEAGWRITRLVLVVDDKSMTITDQGRTGMGTGVGP